jgi:hypothetical protein
MRYILSLILISAFGFVMQTCHNAAGNTKAVKTDNSKTETVKANTNPSSAPKTDEHANEDDAPRISLADAKADFDAGRAIFIDTRPADSYNMEHVKGAINISLADVENRYKEIPSGKKIIAYCS